MTSDAKWSDLTSLDRSRALAAANQLLPPWLSLVLVVVIAWQLAGIAWKLVPGPAAGDRVVAPAGQLPTGSAAGDVADVVAIAAAHIFGEASDDAPVTRQPVIEQTDNLQDTRLTNLSLRGTITAVPPEESVAIIADGRDEEKVYAIGDSVTSGASLHAVYPDRVVLNENGVLRKLDLPREFQAGTAPAARRDFTTTSRTADSSQSIQAVVAQNVSRLADVIRPTPYFVNGQQQGYRVYPGRNRAQFAALGLRPGDLIKDIDGQSLSDPAQAMQIFESLGNADQVSVTVERNGQPEVIVLSTSQLELGDENTQ